MACPFFYPVERLDTNAWAIPPRHPLGDAYSGECRSSADGSVPDSTTLQQYCNFGYGRGRCERFPARADRDAFRFHIASDSGDVIKLQYIVERECWPASHGFAIFSVGKNEFLRGLESEVLQRQAAAFIESYRRRSGK